MVFLNLYLCSKFTVPKYKKCSVINSGMADLGRFCQSCLYMEYAYEILFSDRIGVVMVSVLASSAVDRRLEFQLSHT
jgi:hypothetical protein